MKQITIRVTADDIKKGQSFVRQRQPEVGENCAVARAFQRATNDPKARWLWSDGYANDGFDFYIAKRRKFLDEWVTAHDDLKPVKPFSFVAVLV
jgi:hypothetical protein